MAAKRYLAPPEVHNGKPEMISNPKSSAHGSTLVATPEGAVICAWFGGSREGASDVGIYFSTRSPSGEWSESKLLTKVIKSTGYISPSCHLDAKAFESNPALEA